MIWPVIYTLFLVTWTIKLMEYNSDKRWMSYLIVLPILALFFDFSENIGATIVMARYPLESGLVQAITPIATFIKWTTIFRIFFISSIFDYKNRSIKNEEAAKS